MASTTTSVKLLCNWLPGPCVLTQLSVAATELDTNPSPITRELRVPSFANVNNEALFRFRVFAAALGRLNCLGSGLELPRCHRFHCQQRRWCRRSSQGQVSAANSSRCKTSVDSPQAQRYHAPRKDSISWRHRFVEARSHDCRREDGEAAAPGLPGPDRPCQRAGGGFRADCQGQWQGQGLSGTRMIQLHLPKTNRFHRHKRTSPTNSSLPPSQFLPLSSLEHSALPPPTSRRSSI